MSKESLSNQVLNVREKLCTPMALMKSAELSAGQAFKDERNLLSVDEVVEHTLRTAYTKLDDIYNELESIADRMVREDQS